jgi:copper chaperone CopZ
MKASAYFKIAELGGKHGIKELKRGLDTLQGIISVSVSEKTNSVAVDYDSTGENGEGIKKKIMELGYGVVDVTRDQHLM